MPCQAHKSRKKGDCPSCRGCKFCRPLAQSPACKTPGYHVEPREGWGPAPPKGKSKGSTAAAIQAKKSSKPPAPKKKQRPPAKHARPTKGAAAVTATNTTKRGRGRPPKNRTATAAPLATAAETNRKKKRRGNSRDAMYASSSSEDEEDEEEEEEEEEESDSDSSSADESSSGSDGGSTSQDGTSSRGRKKKKGSAASSSSSTAATASSRSLYLCHAPRPDDWEECAERVIQSLVRRESDEAKDKRRRRRRQERGRRISGRTSKKQRRRERRRVARRSEKAREMIQRILGQIQSMHEVQPQVGPGRKSNTTHALNFYEYLLERLREEQEDAEEEEVGEETATSGDEGEGKVNDDKDEDQEREENDEEDTSDVLLQRSIRQEEHDAACCVCDRPDDCVFVCSTCPKVFHSDCVRPKDDAAGSVTNSNGSDEGGVDSAGPKSSQADLSSWRCAYCVLQTTPKHSKPRRVAAAAVRLMARLKNQSKRNAPSAAESSRSSSLPVQGADRQDDAPPSPKRDKLGKFASNVEEAEKQRNSATSEQEEDRKMPAVPGTPRKESDDQKDNTPESPSSSAKRKSLALFKISNALSPGYKKDDEGGRGKRTRKPTTLYDPQTVPASEWQSDVLPWNSSDESSSSSSSESDEDDSDDTDDDEILARSRRAHQNRAGGSSVVWCNFCKDDPSIRLCCFCACRVCFGKHQQSKLLLCDACDEEYHTFCLDPPIKLPPPDQKWFCPSCETKKKRGARTSPKSKKAEEEEEVPVRRTSRPPSKKKAPYSPSPNDPTLDSRGRLTGREKKRGRGRPPKSTSPHPEKKKRGRGRPPKSASASPLEKKRGPGRPPKSASASPPEKRKRGPGRPPKSVSSAASVDSASTSPTLEDVPVKFSRSGRTVKRSSFHDEIADRDQHLRSDRYVPDMIRDPSTSVTAAATASADRFASALSASLDVEARSTGAAGISSSSTTNPPTLTNTTHMAAARPPAAAGVSASRAPLAAGSSSSSKLVPRRKPGARECMQLSRRFGANVIEEEHMETLLDYCQRGKVEHLIRMRERLDDHARFLELQLAGLDVFVKEKGESDVIVPPLPMAVATTGEETKPQVN